MGMETTTRYQWIEDLKPGDRICEKDRRATAKVVDEVHPGSHVIATGFNQTRISWKTLRRFQKMP